VSLRWLSNGSSRAANVVDLAIRYHSAYRLPREALPDAYPEGWLRYGGLLVVIRKTAALGPRSGQAVAELVRQALEAFGFEDCEAVDAKLCIVIDV
jgi:hypothetical protein